MGQWSLARNGLSVEDLVRDVHSVEGAIILLQNYLDNGNLHFPRDMRERQVKYLMNLMRERGRILKNDPRYHPMDEFYMLVFQEEFPSWVEEGISRRKYG